MEEEVNKEYFVNIIKANTTNNNYRKGSVNVLSGNTVYPQFYIYIPTNTFNYLEKPKELTFLLGSKGEAKLLFPTIDTKTRSKVHQKDSSGCTMSIKAIEDYVVGRYYVELEGDNIILTKVEDDRT